jgi:hypothetical protein
VPSIVIRKGSESYLLKDEFERFVSAPESAAETAVISALCVGGAAADVNLCLFFIGGRKIPNRAGDRRYRP